MGRVLIIAEKPSVGHDIARVLGCTGRGEGCLVGDPYTVTWALGHLVTLQEPDEIDERYHKWRFDTLPILPEDIPLKVIPNTKNQYAVLKRLMNDPETERLICATDAGREGELIFRYIYRQTGCTKPFQRLWISSMTEEAIREGFSQLRPGGDYDGLYRSARCRSEADWLVGMNASRAFTLRYQALLSVGRVQTPTLALLVKRRHEIDEFKPEQYAVLRADFGDYRGIFFHPKLQPDTHLPGRESAEKVAASVRGKPATVTSVEVKAGREPPPQLYDLTSLQRDANRLLGYTADKTLRLAQSLYETRKAITYPRTDSRYLPPDMIPRVQETMGRLHAGYAEGVKLALPQVKLPGSPRVVDASKVSDHHAILPTNRTTDPAKLPEEERQLYDLITRRMLQAFSPACEYEATKVITHADRYDFRTGGRVVKKEGWHAIPALADPPKKRASKKKSADEEEDAALPPLREGDARTVQNTEIREDKTKPPPEHNDASLLRGMEQAGRDSDDEEIVQQMKGSGIGTPATRAAIIERLIQVGYARRERKNIVATPKGVQLIGLMPAELASAEMTGRWELALERIAREGGDPEAFMAGIRRFAAFLVDYARRQSPAAVFEDDRGGKGKKGFRTKALKDLPCPLCGEGHVLESDRAFSCSRKGCGLTLWKDTLERGGGPALTEPILRLLAQKREVRGSTGTITLGGGQIAFWPAGSAQPSVTRALARRTAGAQPDAES